KQHPDRIVVMSGEPGPPRGGVSDDELWQFVAHSYSAFQTQTHPRLGNVTRVNMASCSSPVAIRVWGSVNGPRSTRAPPGCGARLRAPQNSATRGTRGKIVSSSVRSSVD